ncbi:hypothetical protein ACFL6P_02890 [Candidatus Latescibacterota bacterium]
MNDKSMTKAQLISELELLRVKNAELKKSRTQQDLSAAFSGIAKDLSQNRTISKI